MLFKKFPFNNIKNVKIDDKIKHLIKIGLYISFLLVILSSITLFIYLNFNKNLLIYKLGLMFLKLSTVTATAFIVSGLSVDRIRRDLF